MQCQSTTYAKIFLVTDVKERELNQCKPVVSIRTQTVKLYNNFDRITHSLHVNKKNIPRSLSQVRETIYTSTELDLPQDLTSQREQGEPRLFRPRSGSASDEFGRGRPSFRAIKSGERLRLTSKRPVTEKIHIAALDDAENRTEESSLSLFNL